MKGCWAVLALFSAMASAVPPLPFTIHTRDQPALQRGARFYMNYCSGCHSLKYMRYNQLAEGLGLLTFDGKVDPLLVNHLIFTSVPPHSPIEVSMPKKDARQWFGVVPPDLSLVARARGPAWLYAYLQGFYEDLARPFHANNVIFPEVAMPDVLAPLKGRVVLKQGDPATLIWVEQGKMSQAEFNQALQDLVTFLVYVGEPVRELRRQIGWGVLAFCGVLFSVLWLLNRLYWRRKHDS